MSSTLIYFLQQDCFVIPPTPARVDTFIFVRELSVRLISIGRRSGTALKAGILVGTRVLSVFCLVDGRPPSQLPRGVAVQPV